MSLVAGQGPLSEHRAGRIYPEIAGDLVYVEPHPRRVQAIRGDRTVIDTERALLDAGAECCLTKPVDMPRLLQQLGLDA